MACDKLEVNCVKVIYDDTDVFVSLGVYVFRKVEKLMEAFRTSWSLIDINETAKKHAEILPLLIDARAPSGCDSLPKLYGTGKKTVIKHLKDQNLSLSSLGDTAASLANVYAKSTKLIPSYYGIQNMNNLSEVRFSAWGKRTGKNLTSTPKLEFLPPTRKNFLLRVLRAHYQVWSGKVASNHDLWKWTRVMQKVLL